MVTESQANHLPEGANATPDKPKRKQRARTNQAIEQDLTKRQGVEPVSYKIKEAVLLEVATYRAYHQRAWYKAYQSFLINRFELEMLLWYVAFCHRSGRRTASKMQVIQMVTRNGKRWSKMSGYWFGLVKTGMIEPIELVNGNETFILTVLGARVLDVYNIELNRLIEGGIEVQRKQQPTKTPKPYIYTQAPANVIEDLGGSAYLRFKNR